MNTYRMLCDEETEWTGKARDAEHAEEKCFYDEPPASLCRYTLQRWKQTLPTHGKWVTVYKNQCLAPV
jgi:hypothetical protein